MALFIIGCLIAVIGVTAVLLRNTPIDGRPNRAVWMIGGVAAWLIAFAFVVGSVYNAVPARAVGIPITFGRIGSPLGSGIHWEAPWTSITSCPLTEETSIQNADPRTGGASYNQSVPISGSDQGGAIADVTVQYHINAADAQAVYRKFKCNLTLVKDNLIAQRVRSDVANAATTFISVDLKSNRAAMERSALALLSNDLQPFGLTIDDLVIGDIQLNANVQAAANNKLAAQQNAQTQTFNLQAAQTQRQIALVNAQAERAANSAKSQSLSPAVLCDNWITAIQQALTSPNNRISVLNTAGPCAAGSGPATNVLVSPPNG